MITEMKKITHLLLLPLLLITFSCKKDSVDATNPKTFRSSINEMATQLNTRQQVKFNEALYILKTFGSDAEDYSQQMDNLRNMLAGKKTNEIFSIADEVAQKQGIDWSSTGTPSLGEMNIFDETSAKEVDPNEILADNDIQIDIKAISIDTLVGAKALRITPRLTKNGGRLYFKNAALPVSLEIFSGGKRLLKKKNLMQNSDFKGFYLPFKNLPKNQIKDGKIDVQVSIKASNKTYKSTKFGVRVNEKAFDKTINLKTVAYGEFLEDQQKQTMPDDSLKINNPQSTENSGITTTGETNKPKPDETKPNTPTKQNVEKDIKKAKGSPMATVQSFLSNLNAKKLRNAYKASENPNWGSYDNFSNPNSGFGSVKKLKVKNVKTNSANDQKAIVDASYDVEDKNGNQSTLNVRFGLKNINGVWKITSYTIK